MFTSGVVASVKICRGGGDRTSPIEARRRARSVTGRLRRCDRLFGGHNGLPVGDYRAAVAGVACGPAPHEGSNT